MVFTKLIFFALSVCGKVREVTKNIRIHSVGTMIIYSKYLIRQVYGSLKKHEVYGLFRKRTVNINTPAFDIVFEKYKKFVLTFPTTSRVCVLTFPSHLLFFDDYKCSLSHLSTAMSLNTRLGFRVFLKANINLNHPPPKKSRLV